MNAKRHVFTWLHRCEACAAADLVKDPHAVPGLCGLRDVAYRLDGPYFELLCDACGAALGRRALADLQDDLDDAYASAVEKQLHLAGTLFYQDFPQVALFAWSTGTIAPRVRVKVKGEQ